MPRPRSHDAALRERLLSRAGSLLSGGGPEALSLRALAAECGTSTTAVYALFGSKTALMAALLDGALGRLRARLADLEPDPDPVAHLLRLGETVRETALADPHLHQALFDAQPATEALAPITDTARRAVESGALHPDTDPSAVALAVRTLVHGIVALELRGFAPTGALGVALGAALDGWRTASART